MPENSIPGGSGDTIVFFLVIFATGGSLGLIYTIAKQNTLRENAIPLIASIAVLLGFIVTILGGLPTRPFLLLLGAASITIVVVGLEQHE